MILLMLSAALSETCRVVVPFSRGHRCRNRVALHLLAYSTIRERFLAPGRQMTSHTHRIASACKTFRTNDIGRDNPVPAISFHRATIVPVHSGRPVFLCSPWMAGRTSCRSSAVPIRRISADMWQTQGSGTVLPQVATVFRPRPGCPGDRRRRKQSRRHEQGQGLWRRKIAA